MSHYHLTDLLYCSSHELKKILDEHKLPTHGTKLTLLKRLHYQKPILISRENPENFIFLNNLLLTDSSQKIKSINVDFIPQLTDEMIRIAAAPRSFERGRDEVDVEVTEITFDVQKNVYFARAIAGSQDYDVEGIFDPSTNCVRGKCTCPDDRGGYCKHVCAMFLASIEKK
eukprot:c4054_g1_i1.p1 GENE.c4054_g1_i1~~c4054_g1_i1.p1  ORF type:complete len:171 (+),score=64.18 c4054_g1_i1:2-514(+)